jgi:hypothetical protein
MICGKIHADPDEISLEIPDDGHIVIVDCSSGAEVPELPANAII